MFESFISIFHKTSSKYVWFFSTVVAFMSWYYYSDIDYVAANYQSYAYAYFDMILSWCVILVLPLLITWIFYKSMFFGTHQSKKTYSSIFWVVWGFFWVFITWASCCGITLISALWLTSVITFLEIFPYHGIEIKALWIILLFYSTIDIYKNLYQCRISSKNVGKKRG